MSELLRGNSNNGGGEGSLSAKRRQQNREACKRYQERHRDRINARWKDPEYKEKHRIRARKRAQRLRKELSDYYIKHLISHRQSRLRFADISTKDVEQRRKEILHFRKTGQIHARRFSKFNLNREGEGNGILRCSKCKELKANCEFTKDKQHSRGFKYHCKSCYRKPPKPPKYKRIDGLKECRSCHQMLHEDISFYLCGGIHKASGRRMTECMKCFNHRRSETHRKDPDKAAKLKYWKNIHSDRVKELNRIHAKIYKEKHRGPLSDTFVRSLLRRRHGFIDEEISPELIDLKRLQTQIYREINNQTKK